MAPTVWSGSSFTGLSGFGQIIVLDSKSNCFVKMARAWLGVVCAWRIGLLHPLSLCAGLGAKTLIAALKA